MTAEQVIPPIIHPKGKYWEQPHRRFIEIDDTHALMSEQTFKVLKEYSSTTPSLVYSGKMWRACRKGKWYLCWYVVNADNTKANIFSREILVI